LWTQRCAIRNGASTESWVALGGRSRERSATPIAPTPARLTIERAASSVSSDPVAIGVGDSAPDFKLPGTLPGEDDRDYTLAEFRGQPVVLVFYPGDDTPVCTKQLVSYTGGIGEFEALGAQVLAISPQSIASHDRFANKHGFRFPLLADTEKVVAGAYGTLGPLGFPRRSVFVVDADGVIRYAHRAVAGFTFRPTKELVAAVRDAS